MSDKPLNKVVWFEGKDDGSTGFVVTLEQTDGSEYPLFRIDPGGDAMAIGMMVGNLDMHAAAGARWAFRTPENAEQHEHLWVDWEPPGDDGTSRQWCPRCGERRVLPPRQSADASEARP